MVSASNITKYLKFSFFPSVLIFSWVGSSILSCFPLFIIHMAYFSMPNSVPIFLTVYSYSLYEGFQFFFIFFGEQFAVVHVHRVVDLFSRFLEFSFTCAFPKYVIDSFIAITNSNGDSASPWNIPLRIFTSVKLFLHAVSSIHQFFIVILINFMTSQSIMQLYETLSNTFSLSIHTITRFFRPFLLSLRMCSSVYDNSPVLLLLMRHPFCS